MSTVQRDVYLSTIEPAQLSLRAPAMMETWIDVTWRNQSGDLLTEDLAAQLHLTGRSSDHTKVYSMPATDMVNGKARAIIPGGDLTDMNGYRLRVAGTWKQQPWLLAMGQLQLIPAAGVDAQPDDVIDQIGLTFARGLDDYVDVKLWHDAAQTSPYDITSLTVTGPITSGPGGAAVDAFTVSQIAFNEVRLSLTAAQTTALPANNWWSLIVSSGGGQQTLAQGPLTITG
jgi:hypothetical protein